VRRVGDRSLLDLAVSADTDPLLGLANRCALQKRLKKLRGQALSVLAYDLNDFRPVNDRHGFAAGDEVLRSMAQRLKEECRYGDKLGSDEFVVLFPGLRVNALVWLEPPVAEIPLFSAFSSRSPNAQQHLAASNFGLREMKVNGQLGLLLKTPADWLKFAGWRCPTTPCQVSLCAVSPEHLRSRSAPTSNPASPIHLRRALLHRFAINRSTCSTSSL